MQFSKIIIQVFGFFWFCLSVCIILPFFSNVLAQSVLVKPTLENVIPKDVFSDMFIMVKGNGLYNDNERTYVLFSQGEKTIRTYSDGGGIQSDGKWGANVQVPQGLQPGICKVEVEIKNNRSLPFFVNVTQTARPPKLTTVSETIVNPGYFVWVEGNGFSYNQILEMTDAEGQKFTKEISGVSTANSLSFNIPESAYSGIAKFKVIENRNGTPQASNEISFEIRRGAIPLVLNKEFFVPIARGQWFELDLNDSRPLANATKIELKLTQGKNVVTSFVSNFRRIQFQMPKSFHTGKMTIQTRTWIENDVSEWSRPLEFKIAEKSAKPTFHSLETIPLKAEAMFKQNDELVEILSIYFGFLPRVRFSDKIQKGKLEIYTRYWHQNGFTDWKRAANFDYFDLEKYNANNLPYDKEKSYTFNSFFERFFFENKSSEFFTLKRGNKLVIYGNFYVKSANDLMVLLENGNQKIYLTVSEHEFLSGIMVDIPQTIEKGDWRIWLMKKEDKTKIRLPIKIKLD